MKILVIPEDQELDRYIVKPIVEAVFKDLGRTARVDVLPEPRLRGIDQVLDRELILRILDENAMIDLFLLVIDHDCNRVNNEQRAAERERDAGGRLLSSLAREEVEVWMLGLHADRLGVPFGEVQKHCDPKEQYAEPFLDALGAEGPGHGRKAAMRALSGKWRSLRDRCPELKVLQSRIEEWLSSRSRASAP